MGLTRHAAAYHGNKSSWWLRIAVLMLAAAAPAPAVAGSMDSGKSTLVAVLTHGSDGRPLLDNCRGSARMAVFRHKHEIESGRTSSISQQVRALAMVAAVAAQHQQHQPSGEVVIPGCSGSAAPACLAVQAASASGWGCRLRWGSCVCSCAVLEVAATPLAVLHSI